MTAAHLSLLRPFFQLAYVTTDIDAAIEQFGASIGVSRFFQMRDFELVDALGHRVRVHMALANLRERQIELIQPLDRTFAFYSDPLPEKGFALRFHHVGMMLESKAEFDGITDTLQRGGFTVPSHGSFNDMLHFLYVDAQALLGHHLEYIYMTDEGHRLFADVPDNA